VQATWLRLFTSIDALREPAAVAGWLATTTRRECLRLLQTPVREQLTDDPQLGDGAELDGPEATVLAAERSATLGRALDSLPARQRDLMVLLASEPPPAYERISATLSMPVGSIGPIRRRSLAKLEGHPELRELCAEDPVMASSDRAR
jgi:RNA polymerase sigma factor (sigma-70 family)